MNFVSCTRSFCHRFIIAVAAVCGYGPRKLFAPAATLGWCEDKRNDAGVRSQTTTEDEKIYSATARQTGPTFFFFILQRNGKDVAVKPNTESSALLPAVVAARGRRSDCKLKRSSSRCYFPGFQPRETHPKLSHTVDVVQMADLLQDAFSIIFRVFVFFYRASTHSPGAFGAIWKSIFRFAAETHTNTRHAHTHMCA